MLVKVYDVFPWLMYGQVRQPCLELQQNVLAGVLGVLLLFVSLTRMSSLQRFSEWRKATTGTSLKMFLKRSVDCRMGCFLRSVSWMLGSRLIVGNCKVIWSLMYLWWLVYSLLRLHFGIPVLFCDLFFYEASLVALFYKVIF